MQGKVRFNLRTRILLPFLFFVFLIIGALSAAALEARRDVDREVEARMEQAAEVFGQFFATSVLAGEDANWGQLDQVIGSIEREDSARGKDFFAFIVVEGGQSVVGSYNPALLTGPLGEEVARVEAERYRFETAKAALAEVEAGDSPLLVADTRRTMRERFNRYSEGRETLFRRMLGLHSWPGVRVSRATIHDCRPQACPQDLSAQPAAATVLVGIAYAPFLAERRASYLLVAVAALLALLVGYAGASSIAARVTRPVKRLVDAMALVDRGIYPSVPVDRRDEIGLLTRSFNEMASGLAERETLARKADRLEGEIKAAEEINIELVARKERIERALSGLASAQVARRFLEGQEETGFRGAAEEATILFADIRGFTGLCERMSAEEVFSLLNAYFGRMREVVDRFGGCILKFLGDALMVSYNVPEPQDHHQLRAVYSGIEMQRELIRLNREREERGQEPIRVGIGINTGPILVGKVGSEGRFDYTIIGDAVNTAQRIEAITPEKHLHISQSTYQAIREYVEVVARDPVTLKGKEKPVEIYAVVRRSKNVLDLSGTSRS